MAKANLTVQLDTEVIRRARVVAARRGTSVSALVARELTAMVDHEERYEDARRRAAQVIEGADVFVGLSAPHVLTVDMVRKMNKVDWLDDEGSATQTEATHA